MKKLLLLGAIALSINTFGQGWERTNGPYGGDVFAFFKDGNDIFTGSVAGIFHTNNEGDSWQHVFETDTIFDIKSHANLILAGSESDLYISNDNGVSWNISSNGLNGEQVYCIESDGINIFIGTLQGVYKSADNGATWTYSSIGIPVTKINDFEIFGSDIYCATNSGLYKSTNNGLTWSLITTFPLPTGTVISSPLQLASSNSGIYVIFEASILYFSNDAGITWNNITPIINGNSIGAGATINYVNGVLYLGSNMDFNAGAGNRFYTSYDEGFTWSNEFLTGNSYSINIYNNNLYVSCSQGVIKSVISSSYYWENIGMGIAKNVNSLISINGTLHAATDAGMYFSSDNGNSWFRAKYNFPWVQYGPNGEVVIGSQSSYNIESNGNIYFSTPNQYHYTNTVGYATMAASCVSNDGINYVMSNNNLTTLNSFDYTTRTSVLHNNFFYLNDFFGIYKSSTATNWSVANNTLQNGNGYLSSFGSSYPVLYATYDNDIYISTDDGSNFTLSKLDGGDILFCENNEVYSNEKEWPNSSNTCLYFSDNYGSSWTGITGPSVDPSSPSVSSFIKFNGNYYFGTGENTYFGSITQIFKFNSVNSPNYMEVSAGLSDCYHTSEFTEQNGSLYSAIKCRYQPNGVFKYNQNLTSIDDPFEQINSNSQQNVNKSLVRIVDMLGRETEYKPNTVLIYLYSDGTTEKVFKVEL
mgnify:CR=1 FL=1